MEMVKILLDTDMGSDCDDAGALSLLHNMETVGKAKILAVTHCATEIGGAVTVKAINDYYHRPDIPIGVNQGKSFLEEERCRVFTDRIKEKYLKSNEMPVFENSVRVMRKVLANNQDVTLISIGVLNNYCLLLKSLPDDISPLSGIELVKESVRQMYVMGGDFQDVEHAEYNITCDIESAQYVAENFPKPIIYCGFEMGVNVKTGRLLKNAPDENIIKEIYSIYSPDGLRESWDPITVYASVIGESDFFEKSENIKISFDSSGRIVLGQCGKDCYLRLKQSFEETEKELDKYII